MTKEKITFEELSNREDWKTAVIVFTKDSFDKEYSETARSYEISSREHYFDPFAISGSMHGNCLDGTEYGVRLDIYMKLLEGEGKRWHVDYCYITDI